MRTEMQAAVALTAGTRLRRVLLAGLAVIALASCGGGGDDEPPSPNTGWIRIDETSTPPGSAGEGFVTLEGQTFFGAENVTWINETTGESGQASHGVEEFSDCFIGFCLSEFVHIWSARIRVVMGTNVIRVNTSDGQGNFGSAIISITRELDVKPPTIVSISPQNGETGILPNTTITVVFSERMDSSTITPATVLLEDSLFGNRVGATISVLGNVVFLYPIAHLNTSTAYRVSITTGVKDLAGNALASFRSSGFTTGTDAIKGDGFCGFLPCVPIGECC